jgi:hypothetical protein
MRAMANPAELLHRQLTAWRANPDGGDAAIAEKRIAARHIDAIEELLDQMDASKMKTGLYRRYSADWTKLALSHPHGWRSKTTQSYLDGITLEHLEHLADRLDDLVPTVLEGGLDDIRAYSQGIRSLVDEDDSLDPLLKMHVKQVVAHLIWCVDNYDATGDFELSEAIERLASAVIRATANTKHTQRWKDWLERIVWPFAVNLSSAIPSQILIQLALGGG